MAPSLTLVLVGTAVATCSGLPLLLAPQRATIGHRASATLAVIAAVLSVVGALLAAWQGSASATAAWRIPGGSFAVGVDGLSAWFLLPVFVVPALASVYGLGYEPPGHRHGFSVRVFQGVLTGGMALLVLAQNGILFLVGWEAMALSAFFLIAPDHRRSVSRQAAWTYLVATHLGTACLVAAFALMATGAGSLDWSPPALAALPPGRAAFVFALALVGFGLKAGLMPFHVWLPAAHSNAPSHVSAVLSGVMIKMGIYGLLRVQAMLPPLPLPCGTALLLLAALTALLGVAAALGQRDLKRMLAYSSIENIGIIGLGIGLFAIGRALAAPELVALGLAGALLHVLNHSLMKPLLFLSAGSVIHATGTRDMDELGGLLRRMPRTGRYFLVGASAICGLPLLNGFVGEFALYLGLFEAVAGATRWVALAAAAALTALAMAGGLAVLAFVRSTAAVFLGNARTAPTEAAHESPAAMTSPMAVLAVACAVLGLLPWVVLPLLQPAVAATSGTPLPPGLLPLGPLSAVAVPCAAALLWLWAWLRRRRQQLSLRLPTWDCGYVDASSPRLQYTASSFAQFALQLLRWTVRVHAAPPERLELFPGPRAFVHSTTETLLDGLLWPFCRRLADRCSRLRFLQRGKLQIYLLYILVVLVLLLCWSAVATRSRP